jgi:hypothetical protein
MEENIITIFCLVDDILKAMNVKDDVRAKICNAEVLTMGYMAVRYFHGNYYTAHQFYMSMRPSYRIDYSRFIRRLQKMHYVIEDAFGLLSEVFYKTAKSNIYSVDSFPVEVCKLERSSTCNIYNHKDMKGYNASKKRFFYGFKVHMVVTTDKEPLHCYISYANEHDATAAKKYLPALKANSTVIGDKGYVSKKLSRFLTKFGVNLNAIQRSNMGEDKEYFIKRRLRKKVETVFSIITGRFGNVIKATSIDGFLTKLKLFITAYSMDCFLKLSDEHKQLAI